MAAVVELILVLGYFMIGKQTLMVEILEASLSGTSKKLIGHHRHLCGRKPPALYQGLTLVAFRIHLLLCLRFNRRQLRR